MLFIKGIYLLLSHLPTFHTTVRAVRHTAVSCFYTLRRVASCFQPSLRDTSLLFYCRIPSYRVNREFLFGNLKTIYPCSSFMKSFILSVKIITLNNASKGLANQDKPSTLIYNVSSTKYKCLKIW